MLLAIILFGVTYVGLLAFPKYRAYIAFGSAYVFLILGILPTENLAGAIDWNVILMIAGTMGIVALFIESKMPSLLADIIIEKVPNVKWAIVSLSIFSGVISAFVDNVATVLMVAPVAITIAKKLKISPVPSVICIAISSNLQGAATLVGDATSILLGGELNMSFIDFFWFHGKPGIFFVVEAGAAVSIFMLLFIFRKDKAPVESGKRTKVEDYFPTVLIVSMVLLLIAASFIPNKPAETNGYICIALMIIGIGVKMLKSKRVSSVFETFKEIDLFTLLLLGSLFVIIAGIENAGVIRELANLIEKAGQGNLFVVYTIIVFASVLISAVIDNIPYVMTMLPVVSTLGLSFANPNATILLAFGLLVGATLGGNITPIGASANIAGIGILRKEGHEVKAGTFMKYGVPFTLAAVLVGYVLLWVIWGI